MEEIIKFQHAASLESETKPSKMNEILQKRKTKIMLISRFSRKAFDFKIQSDFDSVMLVLKKVRKFRSPKDVDQLQLAFASNTFFRDLIKEWAIPVFRNVIRELHYEVFTQRQKIFSIGEIGKKFYIILRGYVYVMEQASKSQNKQPINQTFYDILDKSLEYTHLHQERIHQRRINHDQKDGNINILHIDSNSNFITQNMENHETQLELVCVLGPGDYFGENSLIHHDVKTFTVICKDSEVNLVSITREIFIKHIEVILDQRLCIDLQFLNKIELFKGWPEALIKKIYYHLKTKALNIGQIIYKEGDPAENIFIIRDGVVEISQIIKVEKRELNETENLIKSYIVSPEKLNHKTKRVRLATLTANEVFGQDEILLKCTRQTQAICISQTVQLFTLERHTFFNYCLQGDQMKQMEQNIMQKEQWRTQNLHQALLTEKPSTPDQLKIEKTDSKLKHLYSYNWTSHKIRPRYQNLRSQLQDQLLVLPPIQKFTTIEVKDQVDKQKSSQQEIFRKKNDKKPLITKISSFFTPSETFQRIKSISHRSKYDDNSIERIQYQYHDQSLNMSPRDSVDRMVIGEPQRNILFEKRINEVSEKYRVREKIQRRNDYQYSLSPQFPFMKNYEKQKTQAKYCDIVRRSIVNSFEDIFK